MNLQRQKTNSIQQFVNAIALRESAIDSIARHEQTIASIDNNFTRIDDTEVQKIRSKIEEITAELNTLRRGIARTHLEIEDARREVENKRKHLQVQQKQLRNMKVLNIRQELIKTALSKLETRLNEHVQAARNKITNDVNELLQRIAHQPMKIKLSEDFNLSVIFEGNASLAPSTGEGQLVGLLFTAALISFSKMRANTSGEELVLEQLHHCF